MFVVKFSVFLAFRRSDRWRENKRFCIEYQQPFGECNLQAAGSVLVASVSSGLCTAFEHYQSLIEFSDIFLLWVCPSLCLVTKPNIMFLYYALQPFRAYCAIWVRRSVFRHKASPRVSPRESTQRRKVELWARNVRGILPKCRLLRYI